MIPQTLIKNISDIYGDRGRHWLSDLPNFLQRFEREWDLKLDPCFLNASFNYVAPARLSGDVKAVLKCGIPGDTLRHEIQALQFFNGVGAVKLLQFSQNDGVMLLEHAWPGALLEDFADEDQAILFSIELMNRLHRPLDHSADFPAVADWFFGLDQLYRRFSGGTGPFPKDLVDQAKQISHDLLDSMNDLVLLHGDLHYANMIWSEERGWLAIDPKGVIGEREYEIPLPRLTDQIDPLILERRLEQFIEVSGFDRQRILSWLFSKAVLAAWWSFEDSGEICQKFIHCAEILKKILTTKNHDWVISTQKLSKNYPEKIVQANQLSYDHIADIWENQREWYIEKPSIDKAILYIKPKGRVLDVGCGSGKPIAEYLLNHGFDVYGLDVSAEQIKHASKIIPKQKLITGDIRNIEISDRFDAIFCWFTLFHIHATEHLSILKKFYRFLLPGGILCITFADIGVPSQGDDIVQFDKNTIISSMFGKRFYHSGNTMEVNSDFMAQSGFQMIADYCDQPGNQVILARKIERGMNDE